MLSIVFFTGVVLGLLMGHILHKPSILTKALTVTIIEVPEKVFFTQACTVFHVAGCKNLDGDHVKKSAIKERRRCLHCG